MAVWAVIADVEAHLGLPSDAGMTRNLAEALGWAHRKRPDLDPDVYQGDDKRKAVCIYAGLLYREGSSAQGIPGYEGDGGTLTDSTAYYRALDLLGSRRPVAR